MGNVCACFCKKASSPDTTSASTNNTDNPEETLNIFEDIKKEIDAGNVHPRDVINLLNNLISHMKENKNPQSVESSMTDFYGLFDKIAIKWEKYAKTGIPQELGKITGSFLKKFGEFNYIVVGLSIVGSILSRALKVHQIKEASNEFITNLLGLLAILNSHLNNNVEVSKTTLQDLAHEIMNSVTSCYKYATSAFVIRMLKSDALEEELKKSSQRLRDKVQNLQLDAVLKALNELDTMKTTHVKVAEDDVDEKAVGIEQRVDDVKNKLRLENKDIRAVAVVLLGQGGMGKSTLAKSVIRSAKPHAYHGFSFAEVCFDSERKDLETYKKELQSSILDQLSGGKTKVHGIEGGQNALRNEFRSKACFVFVDNVVKCEQISNFFPDSLQSDGSCSLRILMTSRDKNVQNHLRLPTVEIYPVHRLDDHSSVVSLRKYMGIPADSKEKFGGEFDTIERIAKLCYGTPILINTLGGYLNSQRDKSECYSDHCDEVISRLEEADFSSNLADFSSDFTENVILSVFNLMGEGPKASFLDICKFFYMREWDEVRCIVGVTTMEELSDRLMIRKDEDGKVMVHDLLRAMAIKLVEKEKNRLIITLNSHHSKLSELVDSGKIEGLLIRNAIHDRVTIPTIHVEPKDFQRLRLLWLENVQLAFRNEETEHIPNKLEYINVNYSRKDRPGQSQIFSLLKTEKSSTPLKALSLTNCCDEFPANMGKLLNLQSLRLIDCPLLRELPFGMSHLVRLKRITLDGCVNLEYLPEEVGQLGSLEELILRRCSKLRGLPTSVKNWERLKKLDMSFCENIQRLPEDMGKLKSLQKLDLQYCESLECLPSKLAGLVSLESLHLRCCKMIETLPDELGQLGSLEELDLRWCYELRGLPMSVVKWQRLKMLDMSCNNIQRLPEDMGMLKSLQNLDLGYCENLECLPSELAGLVSLKRLDLRCCKMIETLPDDIGRLGCLKELILEACSSLRILPASIAGLEALETLDLDDCQMLQRLPEDIGELSSLKSLSMGNLSCRETLPSSLAKLSSMECLSMNEWSGMVTLPDFIRNFDNLRELYLKRCYNLKKLPSDLEGFTHMEVLRLDDCEALEILPDFQNMGSLTEISLAGCLKLQSFPPSISELRDLWYLNISYCKPIQNAGAFIQDMLRSFRQRGKDLGYFKYDGLDRSSFR